MVYNPDHNINKDDLVKITRPDGTVIFVRVSGVGALTGGTTQYLSLDIATHHNTTFEIDWHNCWAFGNGVESNRIRDSFNNQFVTPGVVVSTVFEDYKEEHLKSGLIYSGLYNSTSSVNNLNQFIQAEKITKNINPVYGSIQKLHSRDTDLIALCEDKIIKILANKDALFNADGNSQLTATHNVLGQSVPFVGEYGISKNPESFTAHSYRSYFTDKSRGAVIRLSKDGLSVISDHGMKSWFNNNLRLSKNLIGTYDINKDTYNLTITSEQGTNLVDSVVTGKATISFKENVKGWASFKSFFPENGLSCNGNYYTFNQGKPYIHHLKGASHGYTGLNLYNNFYGTYTGSTLTFLLNDEPGTVKTFHTLNYEGTQSRVVPLETYEVFKPGTALSTGIYNNPEYYNLTPKDGWYVESVTTDIEQGSLNEFIEKEGKWFNYIKGKSQSAVGFGGFVNESNFDFNSFGLQGLGGSILGPVTGLLFGCMDDTMFNYDEFAQIPDGTCEAIVTGCTDQAAFNYDNNALINVDSGCVYYGCTDSTAFNYNAVATNDDSSCVAVINGCTDSGAFNYDTSANTDDASCIAITLGCTNPAADNTCVNGCNTEDGSCIYTVYGCTDPVGCFYGHQANVVPFYGMPNTDDGSCWYCSDPLADNYDMPAALVVPGPGGTSVSTYTDCDGAHGDCAYAQPIATWPGDACSTSNTLYPNPATRANTVNTSACQGYSNGAVGNNFGQSSNTFYFGGNSFINPVTGYLYPLIAAQVLLRWENIGKGGINTGETDAAAITPAGYLTNPTTSWAAEIVSYNILVYDDQDVLLQTITGIDDGQLYAGSISNDAWPNQVKVYELTGLGANIPVGGMGGGSALFNAKVWGTTVNGGGVEPVNYTHVDFPVSGDMIAGCVQPNACNYEPNATSPFDSSDHDIGCIFPAGCSDPNYVEYDAVVFPLPNLPNPTTGMCGDPAACITFSLPGCMDATMFNYNLLATVDDGSCIPIVEGCMDTNDNWAGNATNGYAASNYDPLANIVPAIFMIPMTCNYGACPTISKTTGQVSGTGFGDSPAGYVSLVADFSNETQNHVLFDSRLEIYEGSTYLEENIGPGTTTIDSNNYNAFSATNWNNYDLTTLVDANGLINGNSSGSITIKSNNSPNFSHPYFPAPTLYTASHYRSDCNLLEVSIAFSIGCTDPTMSNYSATYTISDDVGGGTSSCIPYVSGCMNPYAINYNPIADSDDGSCGTLIQYHNSSVFPSPYGGQGVSGNIDLAAYGEDGEPNYTGTTNGIPNGTGSYILWGDSTNNFQGYYVKDFALQAGMASDPIDYQLQDANGKNIWIMYAKITDHLGVVHTDTGYTSSDGWWRVESYGHANNLGKASWAPKNYSHSLSSFHKPFLAGANRPDWNWYLGPNQSGWQDYPHGIAQFDNFGMMIEHQTGDGLGSMPTIPWRTHEGTGASHGHGVGSSSDPFVSFGTIADRVGRIPSGTKVQVAMMPVMDTTKLPTHHPLYTATLPSGEPGYPRATIPYGDSGGPNGRYTRTSKRTNSAQAPGSVGNTGSGYASYISNMSNYVTFTWTFNHEVTAANQGWISGNGNRVAWRDTWHNYSTHTTGVPNNQSFNYPGTHGAPSPFI